VSGVEAHWVWLGAAAALAILELIAPGVFLVWIALAAAGTSVLTLLFGLPLPFQVMLFALQSMASVYAGRRWYAAHDVPSADPKLNDRAARLVGSRVTVVAAISGGEGRVKVGDGVWTCRGPDCPEGTAVRVTGCQGNCLTVEPEAPAPLIERSAVASPEEEHNP
jgi:membrane protein implicated in regulation of membrane protease activity